MHKKGKGRVVPASATFKTYLVYKSYSTSRRSAYRPERLPHPADYYAWRGMSLVGGGVWKSAVCPFHDDINLSLRINLNSGGYCCKGCGARGDDVLSFHRQLYNLDIVDAAKMLGAWEGK